MFMWRCARADACELVDVRESATEKRGIIEWRSKSTHAEIHIKCLMRAKQLCQWRSFEQLRGGRVFEEVEDVVLEA
eukprot:15382249-Heterocapsa_arctica.AAC.1